MKTAIIGYGYVGKSVKSLFPESLVFDPNQKDISSSQEEINACDAAFVCVPTNMLPDGSCDTSIVEESVAWLKTSLIIIRSTVKPGTTNGLIKKYPEKNIIFQPEFIGETVAHPMNNQKETNFVIFGGSTVNCSKALDLYKQAYNASVKTYFLPALEAELVKYFVNTSIAAKVTLVNEFYNICEALGASYDLVREGFLMDPRQSRYFSFIYPSKRGFEGKCIPKDVNALAKASEAAGYLPEFITDILKSNQRFHKQNQK